MIVTSRLIASVISSTILLYIASWFSISTLTFWSNDTAMRFLQIVSLVEQNWQTFAIPYPSRIIDPEFRHAPYLSSYLVINDDLYFSLTPTFNLLSSGFFALFGLAGLPILPTLGGIFSAGAIYALADLLQLPRKWLTFWGVLIATPLGFYSLEIWDHTFGVACGLWGVYAVARGLPRQAWGWLFVGGLGLGFASGQRTELYLFAVAVGLYLLWQYRGLAFVTAAGGIVGAVPVWGLQYAIYGHPLAPVMAQWLFRYGRLPDYLYEGRDIGYWHEKVMLFTYIDPQNPFTLVATFLIIVGIVLLRRATGGKGHLQLPLFLLGGMFVLVSYGLFSWVAWQRDVYGFLPVFPLLPISLLPFAKQWLNETAAPRYSLIFWSTMLFIGLTLLIWPVYGGLQWGARYLLIAYPLLFLLAVCVYEHLTSNLTARPRILFQVTAALLLALTVITQIGGLKTLYWWHYSQLPTLRHVQTMPAEFILTQHTFLPSQMIGALDKNFVYVTNEADFDQILRRLADNDIRRFGFLPVEDYPPFYEANPLTVPEQVGRFVITPVEQDVYQLGLSD